MLVAALRVSCSTVWPELAVSRCGQSHLQRCPLTCLLAVGFHAELLAPSALTTTFIFLLFCTAEDGRPLLTIDGYSRNDNAVQHLSCLVKLKTLIITSEGMSARLAEGCMGLSNMTALTCLTLGSSRLYLDGHGMGMYWTTPWLESLTTLQ
jgi:hypothetical protein